MVLKLVRADIRVILTSSSAEVVIEGIVIGAITSWLRTYESIAIWLEGIALVLLFIWELKGRKEQHEEMVVQMDISRKQIHADRVAEIFKSLRRFEHFLVESVHKTKTFGPGKDYSEYGDISRKGGQIFQEYLDLQEAYYLSYLVSDALAAYMKERMAEADGLQRIPEPQEFYRKLQEFHQKWDVYKMATKIRDLS
jgi:hypothetical protein